MDFDIDFNALAIHDNQEDCISDISKFFWEFVHDVTKMTHDEISRTKSFVFFSNQVSNGEHMFALSVQALSLDDDALKRAIMGIASQQEAHAGVIFDVINNRFVFNSITSLFLTSLNMISGPKQKMLQVCIDRIGNAIDVSELADLMYLARIHRCDV